MKAWTSLNFNLIPPPTPELSALARLKNCCEHSSAYIFDWIFFIFSGNEDNYQVWTEFEFWPDPTKRCRVTALDKCPKLVFMPPTLKKWGSILVSACAFVRPSVRSKKIQARVLKFHIWIPHQKIAYPYFFSCLNYLPLPSYAPFKG